MPGINTGSGSIYPDKNYLKYSFEETSEKGVKLDPGVELPTSIANDLPRLTHLIANNKVVYHGDADSIVGNTTLEKTQTVFTEIVSHCGQDVALAKKVCCLMEQGFGGQETIQEISVKKGARKTKDDMSDYTWSATEKVTEISVDPSAKTFKVAREILLEQANMWNIDGPKQYFKAKTIASGNTEDLKAKKVEKLDVRIMYTKEYFSAESALKANYLGLQAAGWKDSGSLLTPETLSPPASPHSDGHSHSTTSV